MFCGVSVSVCALHLAESKWLHACLQSACLHADRSILNHAAANLLQPQRQKRDSSMLLPVYLQLLNQHNFIVLHAPPRSHHVGVPCAHVGLHMKAWCNLSGHGASGDQVLGGMKLRHSFQLRVQVFWNRSGRNGTTNLLQSPAARTVFTHKRFNTDSKKTLTHCHTDTKPAWFLLLLTAKVSIRFFLLFFLKKMILLLLKLQPEAVTLQLYTKTIRWVQIWIILWTQSMSVS